MLKGAAGFKSILQDFHFYKHLSKMKLKLELNMGIIMQSGGQKLGGLSIYHFPFLETMTISFSNSQDNFSQISFMQIH